MLGQTISHYRILAKLGEGGMGVVYRAEDLSLGRQVALKFLAPSLAADPEARSRFLNEAKAAARLDHGGICAVHEVGEADGQLFIAMAFLEGTTLKDRIAQGPLPIPEALAIGLQVAEALQEAHGKGVVHRDVKPANIMLTAAGQAKVMDFGLAHVAEASRLTRNGITLGTPDYMSPEQARGVPVDHRTDIWSLGVVLYEMVSGRRPFRGERQAAVLQGAQHGDPEPLTGVRTGVPILLESTVAKCLAKEAGRRYQHADELAVDLRRVQMEGGETRTLAGLRARSQRSRRLGLAIVAAVAFLAAGTWFLLGPGRQPPPQAEFGPRRIAIAVLPFANISPDPQDEYLADGMTEELISTLSRIRGFRVIARTSVMRYKGVAKSVAEIGRELSVGMVLEGSVRKAADKLRISAQLIDVRTEEHIWAREYDKEFANIFEIQRDVAQRVAGALKMETSASGKSAVETGTTADLEAYTLYLKGRFCWNKFSEEGLQSGLAYFQRAIERDPRYAPAYAGLADTYGVLGVNYVAPREAFPKARAAAESALAIDPDLGEAHAALGAIALFYEWDWGAAERELRRAIEINPNDPSTHQAYAYCLEVTGRPAEAFAEIRLAQDLDPLSLVINCDVGIRYYFARRYDQAIEQYLKALEMDPSFPVAHVWLARAYEQKGMYAEAVAEYQKKLTMLSGSVQYAEALGRAFRDSGFKGVLSEQLAELEQLSRQRYVSPLDIATIHARLGHRDQAFAWLERAYEQRFSLLPWLALDPSLDSLRSDPRFDALLEKVGLRQ